MLLTLFAPDVSISLPTNKSNFLCAALDERSCEMETIRGDENRWLDTLKLHSDSRLDLNGTEAEQPFIHFMAAVQFLGGTFCKFV